MDSLANDPAAQDASSRAFATCIQNFFNICFTSHLSSAIFAVIWSVSNTCSVSVGISQSSISLNHTFPFLFYLQDGLAVTSLHSLHGFLPCHAVHICYHLHHCIHVCCFIWCVGSHLLNCIFHHCHRCSVMLLNVFSFLDCPF